MDRNEDVPVPYLTLQYVDHCLDAYFLFARAPNNSATTFFAHRPPKPRILEEMTWSKYVQSHLPFLRDGLFHGPVSRPDLEYFKPDYAEDTGPETYHQVDGLKDTEAEEVPEKWDIEHKTERQKGAAEDPP